MAASDKAEQELTALLERYVAYLKSAKHPDARIGLSRKQYDVWTRMNSRRADSGRYRGHEVYCAE